MRLRIRHCVECPACGTRYLIACGPYGNGSRLVSCLTRDCEVYVLYCSCGSPPAPFPWNELKKCAVSIRAQAHGYGPPEQIVALL